MLDDNFTRFSASDDLSRNRGWQTSRFPAPVTSALEGMYPLRTTNRRPSQSTLGRIQLHKAFTSSTKAAWSIFRAPSRSIWSRKYSEHFRLLQTSKLRGCLLAPKRPDALPSFMAYSLCPRRAASETKHISTSRIRHLFLNSQNPTFGYISFLPHSGFFFSAGPTD